MIIEVKNLKRVFTKEIKKGWFKKEKKQYTAVDNISFNVKKGEIIAFVGPNGAGKSTTIKMLSGIIHPTEGEIKVAGLNPSKERKELAYKIGCMFGQKSGLWMHLPAIDTYKLFGSMYDIPEKELYKRIEEVIELFSLEEIVNVPVRKLSLGQRMICEIGLIMLHKPEILFLDEPTIGLDIVVKEKVRKAILEIHKKTNTTIFLTSHDLGDIERICKRIIIIDKGKIIKDESIEELKKEYLSEKIITITYEEDITDKEIDFEVMDKFDNKVILKVDNNKISMAQILERFMQYGNIIDLEAIPVSLEEVIFDIYTRS